MRRETLNLKTVDALSSQRILTLIGSAGLATLFLAIIPLLAPLNYPFRLLMTIVHELGHGLAAMITGGEFVRFVIFSDGSGLAYTAGGWRFAVVPAGYLGAALFGAVLIMVGRNYSWSRTAMAVIGLVMLLFSLRYGLPSIFTTQIVGGLLATISGVMLGGLFLWVALKASPGWIIFLLHLVAIRAGLTAFVDIVGVIGNSTNLFSAPRSDAQTMAELTFIPAFVWAVVWAMAALAFIGGAIWFTWIGPLQLQEVSDTLPRQLRRQEYAEPDLGSEFD
jgi:hypothetical protein